jgi:hypothetical protein
VKSALAFPVLKSCVNTKPIYLTRTCLPWLTQRHNEKFDKDYKHGKDHVEETKDTPGASSSRDHARAKTIKIKVDMEQN